MNKLNIIFNMDLIANPLKQIASMKFRQLFTQIIVLGTVVSSALMMWKSLMLVTNSESPIVVVLTYFNLT
jgi:signal peptidase